MDYEILNSLADPVLIIEQDYTITFANQAYYDTYLYAPEKLLGAKCHEIAHYRPGACGATPDNDNDICFHNQVFQTGRSLSAVHHHYLSDGSTRSFEITASPLKKEDGTVVRMMQIHKDVTACLKLEEDLKETREEWELTFDAIDDIVAIIDPEMKIVRANLAMTRLFQTPREELLGKHCHHMFHSDSEPCAQCPLHDTIRTGLPQTAEITCPGFNKTFLISTVPITDHQGRVVKITHFAKDITERKQLESQLRQSQKMEAIGTLASGVAHDFNNLLTGFYGYIAQIKTKTDPTSTTYPDLLQLETVTNRASDLVQQLLLFGRRQSFQFAPLSLNDSAEGIIDLLEHLIGKNIRIETDMAPDLRQIQGDAGTIEQILMNLAINGRDAMPDGGTLTIRTKNQTISAEQARQQIDLVPGRYAILTVQDTGTGMSGEVAEHIFEPFFTTKEKGTGTGLGLSVVYGIVQEHRGTIRVRSSPGCGTSVMVFFPVSDHLVQPHDLAEKG